MTKETSVGELVSQAHAASGLCAEINPDAQKVRGASGLAPLAANAVFSPRGGSNLSSFASIPGHHL